MQRRSAAQQTKTTPTEHTSLWETLPRPMIGLAPMDGVSDQPFRHLQKKVGKPDLIYTEFTSVEELCASRRHRDLRNFLYDESQRPIIAQIYGRTPARFRHVAILACELGFDGIDINMGCPSRTIARAGAGAGLIRTPAVAQEIVRATQAGIQDWRNGADSRQSLAIRPAIVREVERRHAALPARYRQRRAIPVSIKTRIGYDMPNVEEWLDALLATNPAAIALHGRTLKQGYRGSADWEIIGRGAEFAKGSGTLILGNGDVPSGPVGRTMAAAYGLDGILIGRASLGNPLTFQQAEIPSPATLMAQAVEHAHLYQATYQDEESYYFPPMRKHLSAYARHANLSGALRSELMRAEDAQAVEAILRVEESAAHG